MAIIDIVFYSLSGLWLAVECVFSAFRFSKRAGSAGTDRNTAFLVLLAALVSIAAAVAVWHYCLAGGFARISPGSFGIKLAGLILLAAGMALRLAAVLTLQEQFTTDVSIIQGHKLIVRGVYKIIRHPSYLGTLISFAGIGLFLNNYLSLALLVLPLTAVYVYRMRIEEKVLEGHFGAEYAEYKKRTKRLIPFIY